MYMRRDRRGGSRGRVRQERRIIFLFKWSICEWDVMGMLIMLSFDVNVAFWENELCLFAAIMYGAMP